MNQFKRRFSKLGIALLLGFAMNASGAELETTVTVTASIEKSAADIRIKNIGGDKVSDFTIEVYFNDQLKLSDSIKSLSPGDDMNAKDVPLAGQLLPGNYQFPIFMSYKINSGEQKHSLAMNDLIIRPETTAGLVLVATSVSIPGGSSQDVALNIENPDLFAKDLIIKTYSPGLIEISQAIKARIDAKGKLDVEIPITAKEVALQTQAELIYQVSFVHNSAHHSIITKSPITVGPASSLLTRIFEQQGIIVIVIICLVLIAVVLSVRRR